MSAALAMATAPNTVAEPVFYTDRAAFEAAAGSGLQSESFETVGPVQTTEITEEGVSPFNVSVIVFPDSNNPEFIFLGQDVVPDSIGQLTAASTVGLGLTNAITDGTGALTFKSDIISSSSVVFGFRKGFGGAPFEPLGIPVLNSSIEAFGIDITTSVAKVTSPLIVSDINNTMPAGFDYTTEANTPQFVGVIDPEGFDVVGFVGLGFSNNVAFDRLSYRVVSPASTSEYTLYMRYIHAGLTLLIS